MRQLLFKIICQVFKNLNMKLLIGHVFQRHKDILTYIHIQNNHWWTNIHNSFVKNSTKGKRTLMDRVRQTLLHTNQEISLRKTETKTKKNKNYPNKQQVKWMSRNLGRVKFLIPWSYMTQFISYCGIDKMI